MSLLGSHSLAEFVPYSLGAWHALLAQYNAALWPAQPAVFAASLVLLWRIAQPATSETPTAARLSAAVLALAWAVIGWAFMVERFMSLNWVAGYFGIAFLTQAMLLALFGAVRLRLRRGTVDRETLVVAAPRPRALAMPAPGGPGADPSAWEGLRERLQQQAERMRAEAQRIRGESRGVQEETARARGEAQRAQGEAARMRGEMQRVRGEAELEVMRGYLDDLRLRTLAIVADSLPRGLRRLLMLPVLLVLISMLQVAALRFVGSGMRGVAGAELEEMNDGLARYFGTDSGLLVLRVSDGTPADRSGLESGDVVLEANGRQLSSVEVLRDEIARNRAVDLDVLRGGERRALRITWE